MDDMRGRFRTIRREPVSEPRRPLVRGTPGRQPAKPQASAGPLRPVYEQPTVQPAVNRVTGGATHPANDATAAGDWPMQPFNNPGDSSNPATPKSATASLPTSVIDKIERGSRKGRVIGAMITVLFVAAGGGGAWFFYARPATDQPLLPLAITRSLSFEAYYPRQLPDTYTYQAGSAANLAGELQYRLADTTNSVITITEQAASANPGTLNELPGSSLLRLTDGPARIDVNSSGFPEGILLTKQARITVTGNGNTAVPNITKVIENLTPLTSSVTR